MIGEIFPKGKMIKGKRTEFAFFGTRNFKVPGCHHIIKFVAKKRKKQSQIQKVSIDKIQLPPLLHASMFKDKLVDLKKSITLDSSASTGVIPFLGGNKKKILFVVSGKEQKYLDDADLTFLLNLISACKISMQDIAVVNIWDTGWTQKELRNELSARKILSFGVSSTDLDLPFTIPFYQLQTFEEVQFLFCPELKKIEPDPNAKKILWECLRNLFNLGKRK